MEGGDGEIIHVVSIHRLQLAYLLRGFTHKENMFQIYGMFDKVKPLFINS